MNARVIEHPTPGDPAGGRKDGVTYPCSSPLFTIGALAARTGLAVKTIRFCPDEWIVPATCQSPAGCR